MGYRVEWCSNDRGKDKKIMIRSTGLEMDFQDVYGRCMTLTELELMRIKTSFVVRN